MATNKDKNKASSSKEELNSNTGEQAASRVPIRIYGVVAAPGEIKVTFQAVGGLIRTIQNPSVTVNELKVINELVDFSWLPGLIKETKEEILGEIAKTLLTKEKLLELARLIGNELVGESYYRWDSRVQYYPTLVCIFLERKEMYKLRKEIDPLVIQKKSQVKLRLDKYDVGELNRVRIMNLVEKLKESVLGYKDLSFMTGRLRCNYVNSGKVKWKTTVFAESSNQANRVLSELCSFIGSSYDANQLSVTTGRWDASRQNGERTEVVLHKVSLLVNGHDCQEIIYHIQD